MVAAVYARKSNEQSGIADEQKFVARQIEDARPAQSFRRGLVSSDS